MEKIIKLGPWLIAVIAIIYTTCMLISPWIQNDYDWQKVQDVWERWQALNVGILAFISSSIAFYISRYNSEQQRNREFIASKAFLPHALSELNSYLKLSAPILVSAYEYSLNPRLRAMKIPGIERLPGTEIAAPEAPSIPELPRSYAEVFTNCIRHAQPEVGEYLSNILRLLQIHHTRMNEFSASFNTVTNSSYHLSCLYSLGELGALVNNLFDFARSESNFHNPELTWESFDTAFRTLNISPENHVELETHTKRALARHKKYTGHIKSFT